jgi:hypothetical protein
VRDAEPCGFAENFEKMFTARDACGDCRTFLRREGNTQVAANGGWREFRDAQQQRLVEVHDEHCISDSA